MLAWAAERARPGGAAGDLQPVGCVVRPEERWWLFAMTVAEAGLPEDGERGGAGPVAARCRTARSSPPGSGGRALFEEYLFKLPLFEDSQ